MAPKAKKGKKQQDDWEADLGEDATTAQTNGGEPEPNVGPEDAAEEQAGSGGLLAALKKNKEKRKKKGKQEDDFVEGEDLAAIVNGEAPANTNGDALAEKAPEEATFDDDEDIFAGNAKKGKANKKGPAKVVAEEDEIDDNDSVADGAAGGGVKSKKEKEKEKKEREKQRKKEQAAKKKSATPAPEPAEKKPEPAKKVEVEKVEEPVSTAGKDDGKKKKKLNPALAALQKQQEELKARREEEERLAAEEKAAAEERQRLEEEEEKRRQEAKEAKKQKEKEKKEQLKKEGKYMTEAEKKKKRLQDQRMQQMLASGVSVAGLGGAEVEEKKKTAAADRRKKGPKKEEVDLEAAAERARQEAEAAAAEREKKRKEVEEAAKAAAEAEAAAKEDAPEELEDWEQKADEDVKDSWDAETDDEAAEPVEKQVNGYTAKPAATNGATAKAAAADTKTLAVREKPVDSETESEDESSEDEAQTAAKRAAAKRKAEAKQRRDEAHEAALAARSKDNLRSPICCILGHVDTGKTKLLDKIRQTNVQEGEAGGITQQIGATYFPLDALKQKTAVVNKDESFEFKVPGLLIIDTPGHESFSNLRSRGSSLCNIAILVVDIMHGLEPQTLESMKLLRDRKTPFIVALNKIDRLYGWKKIDNNGFQESLAMQNKGVQNEFKDRLERTKLAFAEQGFNAELYYENKNMAKYVSLVPTSAHTGEGVPDMLKLICKLTQERMTGSLMYLSEVEATVLEVKVIEGLGTTIDVVLSNGILREGDRIVLCGLNGAITTNIRALLTPAPLRELRLKSQYVHNKEVKAALGVKIAANELEGAIAGSRLMVVGPEDDEEELEDEVMADLQNLLGKVSKDNRGVSVQASTLGSLEALLEFLKQSKIPVANISIGPVYKRDVMMAGTMLEKAKQFAVMLCFDVKVDKEAVAYAEEQGIKIFTADIIYHLFDDFTKHMAQLREQKKEESKLEAVFPCVLNPLQVFNKKDPIVIGLDVIDGTLRPLTPIAVVKNNPVTNVKEIISLGRVTSIEREHKAIPLCKRGQPSVAVKIEGPNQPLYGRQIEEKDTLYSLISRKSIDTLKEFYRDDVSKEEWNLIKKLKPLFDIP
ncbi:eukaryotic translation initiation factor 5B [Lithohypha guttulata]|uniref:eukaryotic translation initiation factor 5B n=1 Tax=Lithohypha guttulata TaxID=1690604 RepID=UPI002DDE4C45|nr:eukaryotic translation initiation factor 5B [Lithohypha guttulata]KAK5101759.1 eukaryotic translation initiation factor 5B [Lithohypha guttulata]